MSDDTSLTLATCEAIVGAGGEVVPEEIARSFVRWYDGGRIAGVGSATLKALRDLSAGAHWALSGASGEFAAGSGAAMRIAPLAFVLDPRSDSARRKIRDVARITHRNDEAYAGAVAVVAAIRAVLEPSTPKGINDFDAVEIWASAHSEDAAALVPYRVGDLIVKNWSPVGAGWGRYVTVGKPEVNTQHDFLIWDLEKKTSVNIVLPPDRYFEACAGLTRSAFWLVPGLVSSMQRGLMRFSL